MAKEEVKKKVKRPTALKRDVQNAKRRQANKNYKSRVRTAVRHFHETLEKDGAQQAQTSLNEVYSILDKCVKTGVFKLNKASRTKARLTACLAASRV